jgi:hypothetical protein
VAQLPSRFGLFANYIFNGPKREKRKEEKKKKGEKGEREKRGNERITQKEWESQNDR